MDFEHFYQLFNWHYTHKYLTMLHIDSVIKSYNSKQLLTDIFIECKKGEVIGLLGRNGSGKSSLLKIIFGSFAADRYFIKINNKILDNLYTSSKYIKYLPQNNCLPNHLKIDMIIDCICEENKLNSIKEIDIIKPILFKKIAQVSGGEKRFLEVILFVNSKSDYVLID